MTSSLKVVLYIHSTIIPKQQSICSHTSKCNYLLVVCHAFLAFYVRVPMYRHSKVRSLSSKGLQLSYKAYTNECSALTHISLSLQISVSSTVKSQLFCSCLKRYINNVSLRYSFSLMLTSYIIIKIFVCWFLGLP